MSQQGLTPPSSIQKMFDEFRVNVPNKVEAIWQPLYDYQATVAAATTSQVFFQEPVGYNGRTLESTNMQLAGQIQTGQAFVITGIELDFTPDLDIGAAALDDQFLEDVFDFYKRGNLVLNIGDKPYLKQAPLRSFPPTTSLAGFTSVATTATTTTQSYNYATVRGKEFSLRPLLLQSGQSFSVDIQNRPVLSTTGRLGVKLNGWLFRQAQ